MALIKNKVKAGDVYGSIYVITVFGSKCLCWCRKFFTYGIVCNFDLTAGKTSSGCRWKGRSLPEGVIADETLIELLREKSWNLHCSGYVVSTKNEKMHRYVYELVSSASIPDGFEIDHINGNRSDNRFCNLRLVSRRQNMLNSKAKQGSSSQYRGVYYSKGHKAWVARHTVLGKSIWIGSFPTQDNAYAARKEYIEKHYPQDVTYLRN